MRAYLMIVALALIKVSLAIPTDFSIDMYEGSNHLRYDRSAEAAATGTSVSIETANAQKVEQTSDKVVPIDEAMKLAQQIMSHLEEESSKGQPTKAEPVHVHQDADTIAADKAVAKEAAKATVTKTEETKTDAHKKTESTAAAAAAATEELQQSSVSNSVTEISTGREATEKLSNKSKYINKYGDVLYRINSDKINPLASKSRTKQAQKSSSKKLSNAPQTNYNNNNKGGTSRSENFIIKNGKVITDLKELNSKPQTPQVYGNPHGFMAPNPAFGFPASPFQSGYGAPVGFGAPAGFGRPTGFGPEGTFNLRTRVPQQNYRPGGAITMLNFGRPGPMAAAPAPIRF